MARIIVNPPKKNAGGDLYSRAFDMYVTLDKRMRQVYKLREIEATLGISKPTLNRWIAEGKWSKRLAAAIEKGRELAIDSKRMRQFLTTQLYGDIESPDEVGVDPAYITKKINRRRQARLMRVIKYLGDVIYEIRTYNHSMFQALTAKKGSKHSNFVLGLNRENAHKAWLESLTKLMELFGVSTIKELAMEMLADDLMKSYLQQPSASPDNSLVNININNGGRRVEEVIDNTSVVLSDSSAEIIMSKMLEGAKISGPVNYTGPKETSVFDAGEEAKIVDESRRPNSEGEE